MTGAGVPDPESTGEAPEAPSTGGVKARSGGAAAALVFAGILLSRLFGLVRQRVFAHFFGT